MAQRTELSNSALPGARHTFVAKTAAAVPNVTGDVVLIIAHPHDVTLSIAHPYEVVMSIAMPHDVILEIYADG